MKKLLLLTITCLFGIQLSGQPVSKTMSRLPDTGQSTKYTASYGEDADFTISPPGYLTYPNGILKDTVTGLMWQRGDGGEMTFPAALIYCDTLTLGGYNDWRLPHCHELFSIFNHDKVNPAIDTLYFNKTPAEYWWSSDLQVNDTSRVWVTNAGGGIGNHPKSETISAGGTKKFHVRAVRDAQTPIQLAQHFLDNGNGTITDQLTQLMWQQSPSSDSITWEQALYEANHSTLAGYNDWRLPSIKELESINDEHLINPSVNQTYFPGISVNHYWSSTSLPNQPTKAWYLDTHYGITTYQYKINKLYALCVRGSLTTTAITENALPQVHISIDPNPSSGEVFLRSTQLIELLTITNSIGQRIIYTAPNSTATSFHLRQKGLFILTIQTNSGIYSKKVIIE